MSFPFDRRSYRIPYPPTARGTFTVNGEELPLVDCSERGLRYAARADQLPDVGTLVSGKVTLLSSRQAIAISGTVVRCWAGEVAIELAAPGIPVQAIFAEQRYMAKRFPARMG
jgi:hypothetical protein